MQPEHRAPGPSSRKRTPSSATRVTVSRQTPPITSGDPARRGLLALDVVLEGDEGRRGRERARDLLDRIRARAHEDRAVRAEAGELRRRAHGDADALPAGRVLAAHPTLREARAASGRRVTSSTRTPARASRAASARPTEPAPTTVAASFTGAGRARRASRCARRRAAPRSRTSLPSRCANEQRRELLEARDVAPAERDDHVAGREAGALGRAAGPHGCELRARTPAAPNAGTVPR